MLSVVVLISGGGSNLRALLDAAADAEFPARVVAVGTDRPEAEGLEHAEEFGVPTFEVALSSFGSREAWGDALLEQIQLWRPDLVILSGFMRLLPPAVVAALAPNLINTHPAFLPEFPGPRAVRDALEAGASESGASIIVVDNGVDTGPIIARERVAVVPGDNETTLHARIKPVERRLLIQAVLDIANGTLDLADAALSGRRAITPEESRP
ncbi:phosphoribosylglycinamide formyltransferase [Gryllotalpicola reticulitermitis]|uniref:Phosphoribosylglycinamide formyltransferase n=1 Tax=Gryllotalpicola reticulitermitis TaxID=1184153 RepID=A0ABV8Q1L5_9MICO